MIDLLIKFIDEPFKNILYEEELFLKWNKENGNKDYLINIFSDS